MVGGRCRRTIARASACERASPRFKPSALFSTLRVFSFYKRSLVFFSSRRGPFSLCSSKKHSRSLCVCVCACLKSASRSRCVGGDARVARGVLGGVRALFDRRRVRLVSLGRARGRELSAARGARDTDPAKPRAASRRAARSARPLRRRRAPRAPRGVARRSPRGAMAELDTARAHSLRAHAARRLAGCQRLYNDRPGFGILVVSSESGCIDWCGASDQRELKSAKRP